MNWTAAAIAFFWVVMILEGLSVVVNLLALALDLPPTKRVAQIREMSGDDEIAHSHEDTLHFDVLHYYAEGGTDPQLAIEALKTADIKFARWCA